MGRPLPAGGADPVGFVAPTSLAKLLDNRVVAMCPLEYVSRPALDKGKQEAGDTDEAAICRIIALTPTGWEDCDEREVFPRVVIKQLRDGTSAEVPWLCGRWTFMRSGGTAEHPRGYHELRPLTPDERHRIQAAVGDLYEQERARQPV